MKKQKHPNTLSVIEGGRAQFEKEVIVMLCDPKAKSEDLDRAIKRLSPAGCLKLCDESRPDQSDD